MSAAPLVAPLDSILEAARKLHGLGIACVETCAPVLGQEGECTAKWHEKPCRKRGKRSLVKDFGRFADVLPHWDDVERSLRRNYPCNIALVVTRDMVGLDADSESAEAEVHELGGDAIDAVPARERRPGRGRVHLFPADSALGLRTHTKLGKSGAIDLLGPGTLLVIPPSLGADGHRYGWVPGRAPWEMGPDFPMLPEPFVRLAAERVALKAARSGPAPVLPLDLVPTLAPRVQLLLGADLRIKRLWNGEGKDRGDTTARGVDYGLARELLRAGVQPAEAAAAIAARPGAHRRDADYCNRTVVAALEWMRGRR